MGKYTLYWPMIIIGGRPPASGTLDPVVADRCAGAGAVEGLGLF